MRLARIGALAAALAAAVPVAAQGRKEPGRAPLALLPTGSRIAVVALNSSGGAPVDRVVGDMLTGALRRAGVRVYERQDLDVVLREQRLGREGVLDAKSAPELGRVLGVTHMLAVKATEFGVKDSRIGGLLGSGVIGGVQLRSSTAKVTLDVRLIDSVTGEVLVTDVAKGSETTPGATLGAGRISNGDIALGGIDFGSKEWSESSLGRAARRAVDGLVKRLAGASPAAEGRVLAVLPDGECVVSIGAFDNASVGMELTVIRTEDVRDSQGVVVWSDERQAGRVRITEVRGDRAKARAEGDPVKLAEGDIVRALSTSGGKEKR
jgi:curli biogenesis system outer membrane secretion channel CsgG